MRLVSFCAACEKRRPWADRGTTYWRRSGGRVGVTCARKSQQRAQRCAARLNKLCMRLRHACVRRQVACESEGLRAYAELQRKHRAAYGDNEEAREAAGKAALLRAKALLSSAWVARLRCEERGRLAAAGRLVAAPVRRFRGVRQQVHRVRARESLEPWRKRERESSSLSSVSVSWCGVCPRPYGPAHGRCGVCPRPYGPAHGWVLPACTDPRKSSSKYARALRANAL